MAAPKKVRFRDLPKYACFRPRVRSNPGKKLDWDLMIWHGNSAAERVFSGKPRKGLITTETMVIPVPCPGERPTQPTKIKIKCGKLKRRHRHLQEDLREEQRRGAAADVDEIRDLRARIDEVMFDAMDLDCGWVEKE
jgi:hypothetical protein